MKTRLWHKDFKWDGHSFSKDNDIIDFVADHYPELTKFINEWFSDAGQIHMKTSGSTGKPKTIILRREHMINSAEATAAYFNLEAGSKALLCLPLGFIAGRMMLVRSMIMGWNLDVISPSATPEIPKNKCYDFSAMVPLQLYNSYQQLKKIKVLIVGVGDVSESFFDKMAELETNIYDTYGMTETITHIALGPLNKAAGQHQNELIFTALPGVYLSTDDRKCLKINAPRICDNELVTNDIVELLTIDSFKWLARYDHVINSGGVKLIPEFIESKYKNLMDADFFVFGLPDKTLGERLVLIIEGRQSKTLMSKLHKFHDGLDHSVPRYKIPKEILFTETFTRTKTGKVNRSLTVKNMLNS